MFALSPEGFRPRTTLARPSAGPQLTPLPATLTSHLQRPEKSATLSLAFATLTSRVKHKSSVCHSYKKHPGWGYTLQREMSSFPNLTTRHSPLASISFTTLRLRAVLARRIRTSKTQHLKSLRMNTYKKTVGGGANLSISYSTKKFHGQHPAWASTPLVQTRGLQPTHSQVFPYHRSYLPRGFPAPQLSRHSLHRPKVWSNFVY